MEIRKQTESGAAAAGQEELREISRFARRELGAEEVYTFTLRLCDNEVDRDFERFDAACLEELGRLFVGKCGLFDHQWSAQGQTARLYRTEVVREEDRRTESGEVYCWLKGWAYMLRTERNAGLIADIEGGIKREVSVGCSVEKRVCSICGEESCSHRPGQRYGGRLCYVTLQKPRDAYEWSFVAVPAQREAGVVRKGRASELRTLAARWGEQGAAEELSQLEREAALGRGYLKGLRQEVTRLAALADGDLDARLFAGIAGRLEEAELLELRRVYRKRLEGALRGGGQLSGEGKPREETAFLV